MSGYIEGTDRSQVTLFPDRLEDWIDEDSVNGGAKGGHVAAQKAAT